MGDEPEAENRVSSEGTSAPNETPPSGKSGEGGALTRRGFLGLGGAGLAGIVVGGAVGYALHQTSTAAPVEAKLPLMYFNDAQFKAVEALTERIFPADSTGPGAKDARVANYIDRAMNEAWGRGERIYKQGPFITPTESGHGNQSPMVPRDTYTIALQQLDAYTKKTFAGKTFDELAAADQDVKIQALIDGKVDTFTVVSGPAFFGLLRQNTLEGLFGDPFYGGNRNMIGWRHLGFPGDPMAYGDQYAKHIGNFAPYPVEPKPMD